MRPPVWLTVPSLIDGLMGSVPRIHASLGGHRACLSHYRNLGVLVLRNWGRAPPPARGLASLLL